MNMTGKQAIELSRNLSDDELLKWLHDNMLKIKGHARKYLAFSPYELDEFVQQAHETALRAYEGSVRKGIPFEHIFWSSFRIACLKMTYTQGEKIEVYHEEYREFADDETVATMVPVDLLAGEKEIIHSIDGRPDECELVDSLSADEQKIVIREVLELMLLKERQAWELRFQGFSTRESARLMGVTRQRIQNLLKRGLRRVRKHLAFDDLD
jgi:RNA polymerase sigma factor (sigma-70 family)